MSSGLQKDEEDRSLEDARDWVGKDVSVSKRAAVLPVSSQNVLYTRLRN